MWKLKCVATGAYRIAANGQYASTLARAKPGASESEQLRQESSLGICEQRRWDDEVARRRKHPRAEVPAYFVPVLGADVLEKLLGVMEARHYAARDHVRAHATTPVFVDYEECMRVFCSPLFIGARPSIASPHGSSSTRQSKRAAGYRAGSGRTAGSRSWYSRSSRRSTDSSSNSNNRYCEDSQRLMLSTFRHFWEAIGVTAFLGVVYHVARVVRHRRNDRSITACVGETEKCAYAEAFRAALQNYVFKTISPTNEFYVLPPPRVLSSGGLASIVSIANVMQDARETLLDFQHPGDLLYAIPPQNEFSTDETDHSYSAGVYADKSGSFSGNRKHSLCMPTAATNSPPSSASSGSPLGKFWRADVNVPKVGRVARQFQLLQASNSGTASDISASFSDRSLAPSETDGAVFSNVVQCQPRNAEVTTATVVESKPQSIFSEQPRRRRFSRRTSGAVTQRRDNNRNVKHNPLAAVNAPLMESQPVNQCWNSESGEAKPFDEEELFRLPPPLAMPLDMEQEMHHLMRSMKYAANSYRLGLQLFAESDPARYSHLSPLNNDALCLTTPATSMPVLLKSLAKQVEHHHAQGQNYKSMKKNNANRSKKTDRAAPALRHLADSHVITAAQNQSRFIWSSPDATNTVAARLERPRSMPNLLVI